MVTTRSVGKSTSRLMDLVECRDWNGAFARLKSHPLDINASVTKTILHSIVAITNMSRNTKSTNRQELDLILALKLFKALIEVAPEFLAVTDERCGYGFTIFHRIFTHGRDFCLLEQLSIEELDQYLDKANLYFRANAEIVNCFNQFLPIDLTQHIFSFLPSKIILEQMRFRMTMLHKLVMAMTRVRDFQRKGLEIASLLIKKSPSVVSVQDIEENTALNMFIEHASRNLITGNPNFSLCPIIHGHLISLFPKHIVLVKNVSQRNPLHYAHSYVKGNRRPVLDLFLNNFPIERIDQGRYILH